MMMVNPEVYTNSPNRVEEDQSVQSAIEVIANYVEKVPETNAKFADDLLMLSTTVVSKMSDANQAQINFEQQMTELSKLIVKNLKDNGYSSARLTMINVDVNPGMYRYAGSGTQNRQAMYTAVATFQIFV